MLLLSPGVDNRRYFTAALLALVALAWLALIIWGQSPYRRFLSHKEIGEVELGLNGDALALTLVYVAGWSPCWWAGPSSSGRCSASPPTSPIAASTPESNRSLGSTRTPGWSGPPP